MISDPIWLLRVREEFTFSLDPIAPLKLQRSRHFNAMFTLAIGILEEVETSG